MPVNIIEETTLLLALTLVHNGPTSKSRKNVQIFRVKRRGRKQDKMSFNKHVRTGWERNVVVQTDHYDQQLKAFNDFPHDNKL